jgi:hypothetical protein
VSSGAEHYRQSETWLRSADRGDIRPDEEQRFLAFAQVHATLALAAATAANMRRVGALTEVGMRLDEVHKTEKLAEDWLGVLG